MLPITILSSFARNVKAEIRGMIRLTNSKTVCFLFDSVLILNDIVESQTDLESIQSWKNNKPLNSVVFAVDAESSYYM